MADPTQSSNQAVGSDTGPIEVSSAQLSHLDELILGFATGFINLPVDQIDTAIEDGLRRVVATLAIDRFAISRAQPDTGHFRFTHIWPATTFPRAATPVADTYWPWTVATARRGETVAYSSLEELPPEASVDLATWQRVGTRSHVTIPVSVGGKVDAMLHFGVFSSQRIWSGELLLRLHRLAGIFAIALTRKHGQEELEHAVGFERLATEILASMFAAAPRTEDESLEAGLHRIGEFLGVDWVAVWEADVASGELRVTHQWRAEAGDVAAGRLPLADVQWLATTLGRGAMVSFARESDLPPEAGPDLAAMRALGARSMLAVPIFVTERLHGFFSCVSLGHERAWPERVVPGARLLAEVFASVHARRAAEARERVALLDTAQWRERLAHLVRVHTVGEMSAALAHEINQPLMAIENYALAALRRAREPHSSDKVAELLGKVVAQTGRAGDVVGRFRGMVKRSDIQTSPVDMGRLVAECIEMVRIDCELRDIRIEATLPAAMPTIVADRIQLQQVVLNLLRNAIEATDSAPLSDASRAIMIEATLAGGNQLALCVADRGPGVPEGDIERVFEAFYSTKISGLGIGLSLCRKLIEAHGGSLVAKRRSGGGAAFEFTLPLTDEGEGDPSP